MAVHIQGERRRKRRKRWDSTSRIAVFSLGLILILSEVCSLSSAEKISGGSSRRPPARKARLFGSAKNHARASSPSQLVSLETNYRSSPTDKVYEEDQKRLVHTGPNPLHN